MYIYIFIKIYILVGYNGIINGIFIGKSQEIPGVSWDMMGI